MLKKLGRFLNIILLYVGSLFFFIMGIGVFANLFTGVTFTTGLVNLIYCLLFLLAGIMILRLVQPRAVTITDQTKPWKKLLFGRVLSITMGVLIMILAVFFSMLLYTSPNWLLVFYPLIILWSGFMVLYQATKSA